MIQTENTAKDLVCLIQILEASSNREEKVAAACQLGSVGNKEAIQALSRALRKEADPLVREAIIGALLVCDTEAVVEEMAELLKSEDASCRSAAFEILSYKCCDDVIETWEKLLQKEDRDVRITAVHALGRSICSKSAELFRQVILQDEDVNVVAAAIEYLAEIGEPRDAELIRTVMEKFQNPFLEVTARRALKRLKEEASS